MSETELRGLIAIVERETTLGYGETDAFRRLAGEMEFRKPVDTKRFDDVEIKETPTAWMVGDRCRSLLFDIDMESWRKSPRTESVVEVCGDDYYRVLEDGDDTPWQAMGKDMRPFPVS